MRVYISHCIRGKDSVGATDEVMIANSKKAAAFAESVRLKYPKVDFYCPGEHDEFIMKAYRNGVLNEEQILAIDCEIIDDCDVVLLFLLPDKHISRGMEVERLHAIKTGVPVLRSDEPYWYGTYFDYFKMPKGWDTQ